MDTRVGGQTGLLGTAEVTRTTTRVGGQTGLLGTAGVIGMAAQVSRQIRLLRSARITEIATRSWKILAGLWKIWLTWKDGYGKFDYYKSRAMEKSVNTESQVMKNLANTEN
jgi:hypothetical protein